VLWSVEVEDNAVGLNGMDVSHRYGEFNIFERIAAFLPKRFDPFQKAPHIFEQHRILTQGILRTEEDTLLWKPPDVMASTRMLISFA